MWFPVFGLGLLHCKQPSIVAPPARSSAPGDICTSGLPTLLLRPSELLNLIVRRLDQCGECRYQTMQLEYMQGLDTWVRIGGSAIYKKSVFGSRLSSQITARSRFPCSWQLSRSFQVREELTEPEP